MKPLYDSSGRVHAWLQENVGRIVGLDGRHLAFIERDSVYDWRGNHIGWWAEGHMRDAENPDSTSFTQARRSWKG